MASAGIQRDLFDPPVRFQQDGAAGGFIDAARFHPDKAVFHKIQPPDAMLAADFVQLCQDRGRRHRSAIDRHGVTFFKGDLDQLRSVRRLLRVDRALIDIFGRLLCRILQHLTLG